MGDLAFGKSFDMLKNGKKNYFLKALHGDVATIGILGHIPWAIPFLALMPIINKDHLAFWKFLKMQLAERKKVGSFPWCIS